MIRSLFLLGYNDILEKYRTDNGLQDFDVGRVISERKERYIARTAAGDFEAEISGNMRFKAKCRENFPAVGDWISLSTYDTGISIIHSILPRRSIISRQAVGEYGLSQIIAVNIDYALIMQSADRNYSVNRLERYLAICNTSRVKPVIILTKADLADQNRIKELCGDIRKRIKTVEVIAISNNTKEGYGLLSEIFEEGKTYCMLGSSGVGKSTLVNNLIGKPIMKTNEISSSTNKGKHTTSHRELFVMETGGILIDNPGMREIGVVASVQGIESTFEEIDSASRNCRFKDCTHTVESGCAVLEAVAKGEINKDAYENYLRIRRESAHFAASDMERRKKDRAFGKMLKNYNKNRF
ncbi:MAG: ribosome small subunit-dependent GTPase A [Fibrobacteraceae bacterium]|nr:ribosome small subunit-dependent GTPase A [Fibrobacteraceae bacterium]